MANNSNSINPGDKAGSSLLKNIWDIVVSVVMFIPSIVTRIVLQLTGGKDAVIEAEKSCSEEEKKRQDRVNADKLSKYYEISLDKAIGLRDKSIKNKEFIPEVTKKQLVTKISVYAANMGDNKCQYGLDITVGKGTKEKLPEKYLLYMDKDGVVMDSSACPEYVKKQVSELINGVVIKKYEKDNNISEPTVEASTEMSTENSTLEKESNKPDKTEPQSSNESVIKNDTEQKTNLNEHKEEPEPEIDDNVMNAINRLERKPVDGSAKNVRKEELDEKEIADSLSDIDIEELQLTQIPFDINDIPIEEENQEIDDANIVSQIVDETQNDKNNGAELASDKDEFEISIEQKIDINNKTMTADGNVSTNFEPVQTLVVKDKSGNECNFILEKNGAIIGYPTSEINAEKVCKMLEAARQFMFADKEKFGIIESQMSDGYINTCCLQDAETRIGTLNNGQAVIVGCDNVAFYAKSNKEKEYSGIVFPSISDNEIHSEAKVYSQTKKQNFFYEYTKSAAIAIKEKSKEIVASDEERSKYEKQGLVYHHITPEKMIQIITPNEFGTFDIGKQIDNTNVLYIESVHCGLLNRDDEREERDVARACIKTAISDMPNFKFDKRFAIATGDIEQFAKSIVSRDVNKQDNSYFVSSFGLIARYVENSGKEGIPCIEVASIDGKETWFENIKATKNVKQSELIKEITKYAKKLGYTVDERGKNSKNVNREEQNER